MADDFTIFGNLTNFQRWSLVQLENTTHKDLKQLVDDACLTAFNSDFTFTKALDDMVGLQNMDLVQEVYRPKDEGVIYYELRIAGTILIKKILNFVSTFTNSHDFQKYRSDIKDVTLTNIIDQMNNPPPQEDMKIPVSDDRDFKNIKDIALRYMDGFVKLFFLALDHFKDKM